MIDRREWATGFFETFLIKCKYISILIIVLLMGCKSDRSKSHPDGTQPLCNGKLFYESYIIVGGGAWGGDRVSAYITDSVNFRKYLGTYDNANAAISVVCKGDSVFAYNRKRDDLSNKLKIVSITGYDLERLKSDKQFD